MRTVCLHCEKEAARTKSRGWVHKDGGGADMYRCGACGHKGAPHPVPKRCPKCNGSRKWRKTHTVEPACATFRKEDAA